MAEGTPLRIVMAPKTKRAVALGLAVEAYSDYSSKHEGSEEDMGRWADAPEQHAEAVVKVAERFLGFLDEEKGD